MEFVPAEFREIVERRIRDGYEGGLANLEIEERMLKRDGTTVPVEVLSLPIMFQGAIATLVHGRDISAKSALHAQLVATDRLASMGRVASSIVHEIANPLTSVTASLDTLSRRLSEIESRNNDRLIAELRALVAEASSGAERLSTIVRDVQTLSREGPTETTELELKGVLDTCVRMVGATARSRARVQLQVADTGPVLRTESRLAQVFMNLLLNGLQAIPEGAPETNEVIVTTRADGDDLLVEVRDTGVGISPNVRARMFDPFFTTKGTGGTGLGLAIVSAILASIGGRIQAESAAGRGTIMRVVLRRSGLPPPLPPSPSA